MDRVLCPLKKGREKCLTLTAGFQIQSSGIFAMPLASSSPASHNEGNPLHAAFGKSVRAACMTLHDAKPTSLHSVCPRDPSHSPALSRSNASALHLSKRYWQKDRDLTSGSPCMRLVCFGNVCWREPYLGWSCGGSTIG